MSKLVNIIACTLFPLMVAPMILLIGLGIAIFVTQSVFLPSDFSHAAIDSILVLLTLVSTAFSVALSYWVTFDMIRISRVEHLWTTVFTGLTAGFMIWLFYLKPVLENPSLYPAIVATVWAITLWVYYKLPSKGGQNEVGMEA